jgi:hypothetical protein
VVSFSESLERIKSDVRSAVPEPLIRGLCHSLEMTGRNRLLNPVVTTYLTLLRSLHAAPMSALRHYSGMDVSAQAYCQAIARLPVEFFARLQQAVIADCHTAESGRSPARWKGHRLFLIDGSTFSMPDTPELQAAFGQPTAQKPGCGFPVAHLLIQFAAATGFALQTIVAPWRTNEMAHAVETHNSLKKGDILVGDRGFSSFAHLVALLRRGCHGVFRAHALRRVHQQRRSGERFVTYDKPNEKPGWMAHAEFDQLPQSLLVREVRVTLREPGLRVRRIVLVTTLLDAVKFPAAMIADMFATRWRAEVNLRHLKETLGLGILRSHSAAGVTKELHAFVIIYNLVRRVMCEAARRQKVPPDRISFVDALRWLRYAQPNDPLRILIVHPHRPGRHEPRRRKRRAKHYTHLVRPRNQHRKELGIPLNNTLT